jgi:hypothetical protein
MKKNCRYFRSLAQALKVDKIAQVVASILFDGNSPVQGKLAGEEFSQW